MNRDARREAVMDERDGQRDMVQEQWIEGTFMDMLHVTMVMQYTN